MVRVLCLIVPSSVMFTLLRLLNIICIALIQRTELHGTIQHCTKQDGALQLTLLH